MGLVLPFPTITRWLICRCGGMTRGYDDPASLIEVLYRFSPGITRKKHYYNRGRGTKFIMVTSWSYSGVLGKIKTPWLHDVSTIIYIHAFALVLIAPTYKNTRTSSMPRYTGSCFCCKIKYNLDLSSPDDARTSLCHCRNCKVSTTKFSTNRA